MNVLMIVNGPPYGSELPFNALRLAISLARRDEARLRLFLMGDAVGTAIDGQHLPDGHYHLDRMVRSVVRKGAEVGCCGTCLDARGITDGQLVDGARRSTMDELADWTLEAERLITF
jgi:uncharacterized protein involved in oxidation of intracellular sulfur